MQSNNEIKPSAAITCRAVKASCSICNGCNIRLWRCRLRLQQIRVDLQTPHFASFELSLFSQILVWCLLMA